MPLQADPDGLRESPVSDLAGETGEHGAAGHEPTSERRDSHPIRTHAAKPDRQKVGGLRIYKPGQGYYTRMGTAIGAGVLVVWGAYFVFDQLHGWLNQRLLPVQYGVPVAFLLGMAALLYWAVGSARKTNEFFIATEGEMKKVSWSGRQEVVRSTKVVIVTVVLLGMFLFLADVLFMEFFSLIDVLKTPSLLQKMFGG